VIQLAGYADLDAVLTSLRSQRPVFHSEADLQHALAWVAHEMDPKLRVRLESHPQPGVRLDVLLSRTDLGKHTAIELKYLTAGWSGEVADERFELKNHGAQDVRAYDVVKDIEWVERSVADHPGWDGIVLVLSNNPSYWNRPGHARETNAHAFRLYEGTSLQGVRAWGPHTSAGTKKDREADLVLKRSYSCHWRDYSMLSGTRGAFRLLIFSIPASN
jgi:hypothetical protein